MSQRVAITGASGLIGGALSAHLTARGDEVLHLVRREPRDRRRDPLGPGAAWSSTPPRWTASTPSSTSPAPAWATTGGPRRTSSRSSPRASTAPTRVASALAELAGRGQRPVLVSGSAIGIYGPDRGRRGPHRGQPRRARVPLRRRARVGGRQQAGRRTPVYASCTRAPASCCPPAAGRWPGLLPLARLGLAGPLGSGRQYWSWITLQDEVRALAWAIDQPSLSGHGQPDRTAAAAAARGHQGRGVGTRAGRPCCPRRPWR